MIVGVLLLILAVVWASGGFREGFSPFPKFGVANCPAGSTPNNYGTCDLPCPSGTTSLPNGLCRTPIEYGTEDAQPPRGPPTSCSSGTLFNGICFMPCDAGYSLVADARGDVLCQATISGSSSSPPAGSAASQAPPMTATIPSPCQHAFKSIPGGTMEFRCFDN